MNSLFPRLFPWLMITICLFLPPRALQLPFSIFIMLILILSAIRYFTHFLQSKALWLKLILAAIGAAFIFFSPWPFSSIEMGSQILFLLCALKTFELDEGRDALIISAMIHLLFISLLLNLDQLYYLPLIFIVTLYSLQFIYSLQSGQRKIIPIIRKLLVASLALTFVLFFIFPRVQLTGVKWFSRLQIAISGHSEKMKIEQFAAYLSDPTVVFRASLAQDMPLRELYWRGSVLNQTDGFNWSKGHFRGSARTYQQETMNYRVDFDSPYSGDLYTLNGTSHLYINRYSNSIRGPGEDWYAITASTQKMYFTATISTFTDSAPSGKSLQHLLQFPEASTGALEPIVKAISKTYRSTNPTEKEKVLATLNYINDQGFRYDLSPPPSNSLIDFLSNTKSGFCAHYASAIAALLRLQKVPARVVTGYHGGQFNPLGNYYIIRQLDAHAWNEFWNGKEWEQIDATVYLAPNRLQEGADALLDQDLNNAFDWQDWAKANPSHLLKRLLLIADLAYYKVNTRFSNFDAEEQRKFFQKIKKINPTIEKKNIIYWLLAVMVIIAAMILIWRLHCPRPSAWKILCQKLNRNGNKIEIDCTPRKLMDRSTNQELKEILLQIELDAYSPNFKKYNKQLVRRIKKLKSPL